jgi:hypothetical protein
VLYRLLTEEPRRAVLYGTLSRGEEGFVVHPNGDIYAIDPGDMVKHARRLSAAFPGAVAIADSFLPLALPMHTLVVSSPGRIRDKKASPTDRQNYYRFPLVMPLPTEEEVLQLAAVAFPQALSGDEERRTKQRLQLWGPIPRWVLGVTDSDSQVNQIKLTQAVSADALEFIAMQGIVPPGFQGGENVAHRLAHELCRGQVLGLSNLNDPAYYRQGRVAPASASWALHIATKAKMLARWRCAFIIDGGTGVGKLGSLRGTLAEHVALLVLERGTVDTHVKAKHLAPVPATGLVAEWKLPALRRVSFSSHDELREQVCKATVSTLFVPTRRNWAGCDAVVFLPEARAFAVADVTVAATHGILVHGLQGTVKGVCGGYGPDFRRRRACIAAQHSLCSEPVLLFLLVARFAQLCAVASSSGGWRIKGRLWTLCGWLTRRTRSIATPRKTIQRVPVMAA